MQILAIATDYDGTIAEDGVTAASTVAALARFRASGLEAALAELSLPAGAVAAIGDAENDVVFLKHCGYAVAVANALPEVKAVASRVTKGSRGAGVAEFIAWVLDDPA